MRRFELCPRWAALLLLPMLLLTASVRASAGSERETPVPAAWPSEVWSRPVLSPTVRPAADSGDLPSAAVRSQPSLSIPPTGAATPASYGLSPDIRLHPNARGTQSELSIAVHPENPDLVLAGANSASLDISVGSQGWYLSADGGSTWGGGDTLPVHFDLARYMTDPAVAIDLDGALFFCTIEFADDADVVVAHSTDLGVTWTRAIVPDATIYEDKCHMTVDVSHQSPWAGRPYVAYTDFAGFPAPVVFSRSLDGGDSFTPPVAISGSIGLEFAQGVNLATGPRGELYAAWSGYDNFPPDSTRLGFARSTDGGATWDSARSLGYVKDLRGRLDKGNASVRVNSYPSVAVDRSNGPRRGWIFIVYAARTATDPDLFLIRSADGGASWSAPVRVNQDATGRDQWLPWLAVDPSTGALYVAYYDSRNFARNDSAEVYLSTSVDGGLTFEDFKVSDVPFLPAPIPLLAPGYMGDYIGVAASGGVAWPAWNDDRTGVHQAYTSRLAFFDLSASARLAPEPGSIDFDTVFVGYPQTRVLELRNIGFPDTLQIYSVATDDVAFTVDPTPFALPSGKGRRLEVRFDAGQAGEHDTELLIESTDPQAPLLRVPLRAAAVAAPRLEIAVDSLFDSLAVGERSAQSFRLINSGGSRLDFTLTTASASESPTLRGTYAPQPVRSWREARALGASASSTGRPELDFVPHDLRRDSTLPLVLGDSTGDGGPVDIVALRGNAAGGTLAVRLEFATVVDPANFGGFVSLDVDQKAATGAAPSFGQSGQDIGAEFELSLFSLALGQVDLVDLRSATVVQSYPVALSERAVEFSVPLSDLDDDDGFIDVTGVVGDAVGPTDWFPERGHGTFRGPEWLRVSPAAGGIAPGDSLEIQVEFDAAEVYGGRYRRDLVIAVNDPERARTVIPATLRVTGIPDLAPATRVLDFETVYAGFPSTRTLLLANVGTDSLHVLAVESEPSAFAVEPGPFALGPGKTVELAVTCLAPAAGELAGTLTIQSDDPDEPELVVTLAARAAEAPRASFTPDTLYLSVRTGDSVAGVIAVANAGPGSLAWQLIAPAGGETGVLTVSPTEGELAAGEEATLQIRVVATALADGPHLFIIRVATSDPRLPEASLAVAVDVQGVPRGDADGDFRIDARDIIRLVDYVFRDGPAVHPAGGDPDCDGGITLADILLLVEYVFKGAPPPLCP